MALLDQSLVVRRSRIPGAGKGLFTRTNIPKGTRITEYKGRLCKWRDVKHTDGYNTYLMRISRSLVIDAQGRTKTFGRYANDARGFTRIEGLKNNAEFVSDGNRCFIEALRTIRAGEEILAAYGTEFWQLQRKLARLKSPRVRQKKSSK